MKPDPLKVRQTTAQVVKNLAHLTIDENALNAIAQKLKQRITKNKILSQEQFGKTNVTPQLVFICDTVNFCFWSPKGKPRWQVEYPKGTVTNGWQALVNCFHRALEKNQPILNAKYLQTISLKDTQKLFQSSNQTTIPLIKNRANNLRESGKVLTKKFQGKIENLLASADYDAGKIAKSVVKNFPSFQDSATTKGKRINFYKRAQIFAYDVSLLKKVQVQNIEALTVFADYKLPQILRHLGALRYSPQLANQVDSLQLIAQGSDKEIEIRSATIWVGERLSQILKIPAALVDNALWYLSQESNTQLKPYHRTLTTSY